MILAYPVRTADIYMGKNSLFSIQRYQPEAFPYSAVTYLLGIETSSPDMYPGDYLPYKTGFSCPRFAGKQIDLFHLLLPLKADFQEAAFPAFLFASSFFFFRRCFWIATLFDLFIPLDNVPQFGFFRYPPA